MEKIEHSDAYSALLWGSMATTVITLLLYLLQWYKTEQNYVMPPLKNFYVLLCQKELTYERCSKADVKDSSSNRNIESNAIEVRITNCSNEEDDEEENVARPLLSLPIAIGSFLRGMAAYFPALIVLVLAWSIGHVMVDIGADRLFARWIMNSIEPKLLPTITFMISFMITLSIGSAWGTMSILYPLVLVPTYISSHGNETIFYAVIASVLNGAIAGNHMCPLSDTTIISSRAADCDIRRHVATRTPYCIVVVFLAIMFGTLPAGYQVWPSYFSTIIGVFGIVIFVYLGCAPILETNGKYDVLTEMYLKFVQNDCNLSNLREDTIMFITAAQQIDFPDLSTSPNKDSLKETDQEDVWSVDWSEDDFEVTV
jgi:Na+/H+ antiporter family